MHKLFRSIVFVASLLFVCSFLQGAHIELVSVNIPGSTDYGVVDYDYHIGTYEVTNNQYVEFLNAKAASDSLALYNANMANPTGGIVRSGDNGSFSYTVKPNMGNKPVNYVSWYDAVRFVNWLSNGQADSDTESGSYTLTGNSRLPENYAEISRSSEAVWLIPTRNEWYKAAYYDPRAVAQGGPPGTSHYWLYPTSTNLLPAVATANNVGNVSNPGSNVARYAVGPGWGGVDGNVTTVGSAGSLSTSFFGTYDQAGNVSEWTETEHHYHGYRWLMGGGWNEGENELRRTTLRGADGTTETSNLGFRVANVPEPNAMKIALLGILLATIFTSNRNSAGLLMIWTAN